MKKIIAKHGLTAAVVSLLVLVFAFGGVYSRFMTAQIAARANGGTGTDYIDMMTGATSSEVFATADVVKTYALADDRGDFTPSVLASYRLSSDAGEIGVVYVVSSHGKFPGIQIAFAFDLATDEVVAVKVVAQAETPAYYGTLDAAFFAQFDGMALADVGLAVDAVAGATYSSKSFEIALLYAREHYAVDYGFQIPSIAITLNSLTRNFDLATFIAMPYVADVTYGEDDVNVVVYLDAAFDVAGVLSGTEPAADVKAAIKSLAAADASLNTRASFVQYDPDSRELVMQTKGYSSNPIRVTIVLNATLDAIVSYEVDSHETYSEEEAIEDSGYGGGEVPWVENSFIDDYRLDGVLDVDAVGGASYTSPAMKALVALLDQFLGSVGGGD